MQEFENPNRHFVYEAVADKTVPQVYESRQIWSSEQIFDDDLDDSMASSQQKFESDLPVREFPIEDGEEEEPPIAFLHLDLQRPLTSTSTFGANSRSNRMQMQRG